MKEAFSTIGSVIVGMSIALAVTATSVVVVCILVVCNALCKLKEVTVG